MTDRAMRVLKLAEGAARAFGAPFVEPEHSLLALAEEEHGLAGELLKSLGVDRDAISQCLEDVVAAQDHANEPDSHIALDQLQHWAAEELAPLRHHYVGTEHLLLALTRVSSGRCPKVLAELDMDSKQLRKEVYSILGHLT